MRTILIALILAALSAPVFADDAASATFFIERIEVRNAKRVSPDVVIAESRLREGEEYSEDALRDAATRLSRLPFLLSVDFALEKGSERGRHVLVLTIQETKPFFYLLDHREIAKDQNGLERFRSSMPGADFDEVALGFRWFVGNRGAVHLGLANDYSEVKRDFTSLAVGYTQYDLFGTRAFATLNLKRPIEGSGQPKISPQVVVGIPLSANQTATLEFDQARFTERSRDLFFGDLRLRGSWRQTYETISARWSYNTTNDPFLPTRGVLLDVESFVERANVVGSFATDPPTGTLVIGSHTRRLGLEMRASRYWEMTERSSIFGDLLAWWTRDRIRASDVLNTYSRKSRGESIGIGITHGLWDRSRRATGDSRLELAFRYANRHTPSERCLAPAPACGYPPDPDVRQAVASWVRRSSWGTLRLGGGWAW